MSDLPAIFSGPMVQALLDGRKMQTRRHRWRRDALPQMLETSWARLKPGDRLWVKETHWLWGRWRLHGKTPTGRRRWRFEHAAAEHPEARFTEVETLANRVSVGWRKRPAIFLQRKHSRITLVVERVSIEKLQKITEADAQAEGMYHFADLPTGPLGWSYKNGAPATHLCDDARNAFGLLWCLINGEADWDRNPEVVVVQFRVVQQNIDQIREAA